MAAIQSLRDGFSKILQTKRFILFAWILSFSLALLVTLPMLSQLEKYTGETVMEEKLLHQMDSNWFQTFKMDQEENELVRQLDFSILGYAPFFHHFEGYLSGVVVTKVADFFVDLIVRWKINPAGFDLLLLLTIVHVVLSTFLAGAFISIYAKTYDSSFGEFLIEGGKYFGKMFRLSLLSLAVYALLFFVLIRPLTGLIPDLTANEPSEMTPFLYYMGRNVAVILLLGFLTLMFDYAKIRMIVDNRSSAFFAFSSGVSFAISHFRSVTLLYLTLSAIGVALIVLYALIESYIPQTSGWEILGLFLLQQLYMISRYFLKATFYSSQTSLYITSTRKDYLQNL